MIRVGLTGSIGMGKSTAALALKRLGLPVWDADAAVHRLLGPAGAGVAAVRAAFPSVADGDQTRSTDGINRQQLGALVFGDPQALARLEAILHPLVQRERQAFLAKMARQRRRLVILDIPLLYETGGDRACDAVLLVSAPAFLQRQRVLRRPGMTDAKFRAILRQQWPDAKKRRRTRYVVPTGLGRRAMLIQLSACLADLERRAAL